MPIYREIVLSEKEGMPVETARSSKTIPGLSHFFYFQKRKND
jgi:hypothetical protein